MTSGMIFSVFQLRYKFHTTLQKCPDTISYNQNDDCFVSAKLFSDWKDRAHFMHRSGHTSITICKVAKLEEADLIIVESHGRGIVDRALLGSVAHGVLNRSLFPVLVVRE
jgi:hypothetical protein